MSKNGIFQGVPAPNIRRSKFDLSKTHRFTGKMGKIIPFLNIPVNPGEHFRMTPTLMARIAPMLAPIMDQIIAKMHMYYIPYRILCSEWEDFISPPGDGEDIASVPSIDVGSVAASLTPFPDRFNACFGKSSLWNYTGLPFMDYTASILFNDQLNSLHWLAYQKVFDDYYRDENFVDETFDWPVAGGTMSFADTEKVLQLRRHAWAKDRFTSALPFPQRGADVLIPIDAVPTYKTVSDIYLASGADPDTSSFPGVNLATDPADTGQNVLYAPAGASLGQARIENIESISNSSVTINDFRTAVVVQQWLETSARGGARYKESIPAHWGSTISDYRLDRAEYLGGSTQTIMISEVLANAYSSDGSETLPIGTMAGHGITVGGATRVDYRCPEHGVIFGMVMFQPVASYKEGLERYWTRLDKFDYPWPEFVGLGEEQMLKKEIYWNQTSLPADYNELFGYQLRYYDMKSSIDQISGDFVDSLAFWLAGARTLGTIPTLNEDFIYQEPGTDFLAVQDGTDYIWAQIHTRISAMRPFPYYSVPGITKI